MEVIIDFATKNDFEEVDKLLSEISEAIVSVGNKWSNYKVNSAKEKRYSTYTSLINGQNRLFIARFGAQIIGCINLQLVQNIRHGWIRGHIEEVVVKSEFRVKGVGTKLLNAVKDYCKKNDIKVIKLMCGKQLLDAHKFYEKNGFSSLDIGYRLELN